MRLKFAFFATSSLTVLVTSSRAQGLARLGYGFMCAESALLCFFLVRLLPRKRKYRSLDFCFTNFASGLCSSISFFR